MRSLASIDDGYYADVERNTLRVRHRSEPRWTRLRDLLYRNGLRPEHVLVADYSEEGPTRYDERDGESLHLVIVTQDGKALLLNVFLDGVDVDDAIRSVEELPTSGDGLPTMQEALQWRRDGDRSRSNLTNVAYLNWIRAALELLASNAISEDGRPSARLHVAVPESQRWLLQNVMSSLD